MFELTVLGLEGGGVLISAFASLLAAGSSRTLTSWSGLTLLPPIITTRSPELIPPVTIQLP